MSFLHMFYPDEYLDSTYEIDFDLLYKKGYRGVIFDIADGLDKQKLIDVLDARATRSKSFNADIIALRNGNVLFVRRYKK